MPPVPLTAPPTAPPCYLGVVLARDAVVITAASDGSLEWVTVRVGDRVAAQQVVAQVDTRILRQQVAIEQAALRAAQAEHQSRTLQVRRAEQEERRRELLHDVLSQEEINAAKFERQQAEAMAEAGKSAVAQVEARLQQLELSLARAQITTPFAGTVAQRYLDAGALVSQGTPILRLISGDGMLSRFAVPPEQVATVPIGSTVRVEVQDLPEVVFGKVEHLAPEIDPASQMVFVEAQLDLTRAAALPSGALARVSAWGAGGVPSCLP